MKHITGLIAVTSGDPESLRNYLADHYDFIYEDNSAMKPMLLFAGTLSSVDEQTRQILIDVAASSVNVYDFAQEVFIRVNPMDLFYRSAAELSPAVMKALKYPSRTLLIERAIADILAMGLDDLLGNLVYIFTHTEECPRVLSAALIHRLAFTDGVNSRVLATMMSRSLDGKPTPPSYSLREPLTLALDERLAC